MAVIAARLDWILIGERQCFANSSRLNILTLTFVRLVLGVTFFMHGSQKMLGWFGGYGFQGTMGFFTQQMGIPAPLASLAICAEFFGGIGLIVGLLSHIAAFGIIVNMLVAIATDGMIARSDSANQLHLPKQDVR